MLRISPQWVGELSSFTPERLYALAWPRQPLKLTAAEAALPFPARANHKPRCGLPNLSISGFRNFTFQLSLARRLVAPKPPAKAEVRRRRKLCEGGCFLLSVFRWFQVSRFIPHPFSPINHQQSTINHSAVSGGDDLSRRSLTKAEGADNHATEIAGVVINAKLCGSQAMPQGSRQRAGSAAAVGNRSERGGSTGVAPERPGSARMPVQSEAARCTPYP